MWTIEYFCYKPTDKELPVDNMCTILNEKSFVKFTRDSIDDEDLVEKQLTSFRNRLHEDEDLAIDEYQLMYICLREYVYNRRYFSVQLFRSLKNIDVSHSGCLSLKEFELFQ